MSRSLPDDMLGWEDLVYLADLVQLSGEEKISLLGGEPTLHPEFVDLVLYLLARELSVTVFTSGIVPESTLRQMTSSFMEVPKERLHFVCNLNDPAASPEGEHERIRPFLERFGHRTVPGFNIYRPRFDMDFLFRLINEYGLVRQVRIGLAHPIPGERNQFVAVPEIKTAVECLLSYMPLFERFRVSPGLDCGFPLCAFTDEQLGRLHRLTGEPIRGGCQPAFDIGPDMKVWCCFPLAGHHKRSVLEFNSIPEIVEFYHGKLRNIRIEAGGIYEECDGCGYREEGRCAGGCVAHILSALRDEEPVRYAEVYP
jgi:MoaA/NifB/PqqE/SkfB family radical SAM enzyme